MEDDVRQRTCFPLLPVGLGKGGGEHGQEARERVWYREVGAPAQLAS